jgi:DNA-binding IclR family transcriptional regulator
MARSSPGVRRIAAILNFVADHPGQSFTLTDLVRALKLSRATCHALLTGLVEVGYLYRTSDKSYVLGPALAAISRAVSDHFSPLQVAQPEMRALADEYDVVCTAFFLDGDAIHVRERATSISHVGGSVPLGTRIKLRVSSAPIFHAWSPREEVEAWLASFSATTEQREMLEKGMDFARSHGFVVLIDEPGGKAPPSTEPGLGSYNGLPIRPIFELDPAQSYPVASLLAPIFSADGRTAFAMGLHGFDRSMSGAEAAAAANHLRAACDRITGYIGGRPNRRWANPDRSESRAGGPAAA